MTAAKESELAALAKARQNEDELMAAKIEAERVKKEMEELKM